MARICVTTVSQVQVLWSRQPERSSVRPRIVAVVKKRRRKTTTLVDIEQNDKKNRKQVKEKRVLDSSGVEYAHNYYRSTLCDYIIKKMM